MQEEFVGLAVLAATEFRSIVRKHPVHLDSVLIVKGQQPVIEQVGCGQDGFLQIDFGEAVAAVGVDGGLLVDAAYALDGAHVAGVLSHQKAGVGALLPAMGLFFFLGCFQDLDLGFGKHSAVFSRPLFQAR